MKDTENKKPDYCGYEDSPIIGCRNQPNSFGYNLREIEKYLKEKGNGRDIKELIDNNELEQFKIK